MIRHAIDRELARGEGEVRSDPRVEGRLERDLFAAVVLQDPDDHVGDAQLGGLPVGAGVTREDRCDRGPDFQAKRRLRRIGGEFREEGSHRTRRQGDFTEAEVEIGEGEREQPAFGLRLQ